MTSPMGGYEEIEHTADLCLRVHGSNLAELLTSAAQGLQALMQFECPADPAPVHHVVSIDADDRETLLVDWLSELIFLGEHRGLCCHHILLSDVSDQHLLAHLEGSEGCVPRQSIKAATYSGLDLTPRADGSFHTTITLDA